MDKINMIVFDLDGTLLNNEELIPSTTINLIKKLKENGIIIVVASGRTLFETEIVPELFNIINYAITSDGSNLLDVENRITLYNKVLTNKDLNEIFNLVQDEKVSFTFYTNEGEFDTLPVNAEITKLKLHFENTDLIQKYRSLINNKESYKAISMTHYDTDEQWLAINPLNSDKGFGIKILKELLNIKKENVVTFGDRNNDISSFKESAISVAMENATEEVKKNATDITLSNKNLGVEKFLINQKVFKEIL